jgi:hypothetical protein
MLPKATKMAAAGNGLRWLANADHVQWYARGPQSFSNRCTLFRWRCHCGCHRAGVSKRLAFWARRLVARADLPKCDYVAKTLLSAYFVT